MANKIWSFQWLHPVVLSFVGPGYLSTLAVILNASVV